MQEVVPVAATGWDWIMSNSQSVRQELYTQQQQLTGLEAMKGGWLCGCVWGSYDNVWTFHSFCRTGQMRMLFR